MSRLSYPLLNQKRKQQQQDPAAAMAPAGYGPPPVAQNLTPSVPGSGMTPSRMQRDDFNRANSAESAANFAAAAPAPTQSAYGSTQAGAAARNAYIGRNQRAAQFYSGGQFQANDLADTADARENSANTAAVGLMGAQAGYLGAQTRGSDANTRLMVPATANATNAQANVANAGADQTRFMTPYAGAQMGAQTQALQQQNGLTAKYGAPLMQGQVERQGLENQRFGAETPHILKNLDAQAGNTAELYKGYRGMVDDLRGIASLKTSPQAPADPGAGLENLTKQRKLQQDEADRLYKNQGWLPYLTPGLGLNKNDAYDQAGKNLAPQLEEKKAPDDGHPEGTTIINPQTGKRKKKVKGQWVDA